MRISPKGFPHPYYGASAGQGLHVLRNVWQQRSYLVEHCEALTAELSVAIEATRSDAPCRWKRDKSFRIHAPDNTARVEHDSMGDSSKERRMERRIYDEYSPACGDTSNELWQQLVALQVPLAERRKSEGWGRIDLLALTKEGGPVVVELKTDESSETPLRAILEGLANAVAVSKNWPQMSQEIKASLKKHGNSARLTDAPSVVRTLVLAPDSYWREWGAGGLHSGREVTAQSRAAVRMLREKAETMQFPIDLGTFNWPDEKISVHRADVDW